ncbi:hypothetical protein PR003_g445 [Phytophthora rubi]|uniref:Secreted protein n=1 Tax=Phytophthora rubi TaxID=129364 RepID=A0A6A3NWG3_9STRA|nr:hypothetical protein PR001_g2826 [Phytophthora rubi]KAE9360019.1 hypothetical protein PR003_g445 [Phytophthora rubi]
MQPCCWRCMSFLNFSIAFRTVITTGKSEGTSGCKLAFRPWTVEIPNNRGEYRAVSVLDKQTTIQN